MEPRVVVPPVLEFDDETLFILARGCYTQEDANEYIRLQYPNWVWADRVTKTKGVKGDQQVAGTYSLDACRFGGKYHQCSPNRERTNQPYVVTGGVATVRHMPKKLKAPRHRIYPKSYLPTRMAGG